MGRSSATPFEVPTAQSSPGPTIAQDHGSSSSAREQHTYTAQPAHGLPLDSIRANLRAKLKLQESMREGAPISHYELCQRPLDFFPWESDTFAVFGVLWERGMPFLEVLGLLANHNRRPQCYTLVPRVAPLLQLPSGAMVDCSPYWPAKKMLTKYCRIGVNYRHGVGRASMRYYCPVPSDYQTTLARLPSFNITLYDSDGHSIRLSICRRKFAFTEASVCPNPLYGVKTIHKEYPLAMPEFAAQYNVAGFGRVQLYDMFGDALLPLLRHQIEQGLVEYHPFFASGILSTRSLADCECVDDLKHDHCLFTNSLRSRWIFLSNAPDAFMDVGSDPDGKVQTVLAKYPDTEYDQLIVAQVQCGNLKTKHGASILTSFTYECESKTNGTEARLWGHFPFLNPRIVFNAHIHFAGVKYPPQKQTRPPPSLIITRHFPNTHRQRHVVVEPILRDNWAKQMDRRVAERLRGYKAGPITVEVEPVCQSSRHPDQHKKQGHWKYKNTSTS
eukprot:NODE_1418_length_1743_cov_32.889506_g1348_i0.p1 GENE.NODE_1418_length_1743_cov_32.889506_g1348_i0~~NODE_1418_length_1743_cov_32.889506_g1348_i0.p1  ORF type:complete len:501 (+),score=30.44 NODE_1418_length_1743_cov_32.889506_g1348_i0:201-1703(+)